MNRNEDIYLGKLSFVDKYENVYDLTVISDSQYHAKASLLDKYNDEYRRIYGADSRESFEHLVGRMDILLFHPNECRRLPWPR